MELGRMQASYGADFTVAYRGYCGASKIYAGHVLSSAACICQVLALGTHRYEPAITVALHSGNGVP